MLDLSWEGLRVNNPPPPKKKKKFFFLYIYKTSCSLCTQCWPGLRNGAEVKSDTHWPMTEGQLEVKKSIQMNDGLWLLRALNLNYNT